MVGTKSEIEKIILPSSFDLSRIDMTGTFFEKEHGKKPILKSYKKPKKVIEFFDFGKVKKDFEEKINFFSEKDLIKHKTLAEKILHIVTSKRYRNSSLDAINLEKYRSKFLAKINQCIARKVPIELMLPAFPFKIKNPLKSQRGNADFAEIGAFLRFHEICLQIKKIYVPGAKFFVFHDGHLYYRHFLHSLNDATVYLKTLKRFLKELELEEEIVLLDAEKELEKIKDFKKVYSNAREEIGNLWKYKKYDEKIQKIIKSSQMNLNLSNIPYEKLRRVFYF